MASGMNFGRLSVAAVAAWIVSMPVGFLVNEVLLKGVYAQNAAAFRPPDQVNLVPGFVTMLIGFFVFAYAYAKGYEGGSGVAEGLRFGVIVALMLVCFVTVWEYVTVPISAQLLAYWIVDYIVEFALYGSIVGAIYKPASLSTRH